MRAMRRSASIKKHSAGPIGADRWQWRSARACKVLPVMLGLVLLAGCQREPVEYRFEGNTMGTYYLVHAFCDYSQPGLQARVDALLEDVNDQMSTYREQSVLSRLNRAPIGTWFDITPELAEVLQVSQTLAEQSDGAFDITVGPVVNLWGFGPDGQRDAPPSDSEIERALERVGYQSLEVRAAPPAARRHQDIYVDLSGIAKGYGVDAVFELLAASSCEAALVDIGGDLRVGAERPDGRGWRIGIEVPEPDTRDAAHRVIELTDKALVTSGDYRNFLEHDGQRLSHTMDPRTGRPVTHQVASITTIHRSATWADGYATLFGVLAPDDALALADEQSVPVFMLVQDDDNGIVERYAGGFDAWLDAD